MELQEWKKGEYLLSTDKSKIDLNAVHHFLSRSYWAENIPIEIVQKSIDHSLCFAIYHHQRLIGFARVISDFATFAYLADVFIIPEERGKGLSKWLVQTIMDYPYLQGLRRFTLATRDAHKLYAQFGFTAFDKPERWMQKTDPHIYKRDKIYDKGTRHKIQENRNTKHRSSKCLYLETCILQKTPRSYGNLGQVFQP